MNCDFCYRKKNNFCCLWYKFYFITGSTDWDSSEYKNFLLSHGVNPFR